MGQESTNVDQDESSPRSPRDRYAVALRTAQEVLDDDASDRALILAAGQLLMTHSLMGSVYSLRVNVDRAVDRLEGLAQQVQPLLTSPAAKVAQGANRLRRMVVGGG